MDENKIEALKVGDLVGINSHRGAARKVYKIVPIDRITPQRIVADGWSFRKDSLAAVGGYGSLQLMTDGEIAAWHAVKAREEEQAEERRRNYDPSKNDDSVQAALRSMRGKARNLCEKLQADVEARLASANPGAMQPGWWSEYLQMLMEIEQSENALKSFGVSTTLKPSAAQSSLFR